MTPLVILAMLACSGDAPETSAPPTTDTGDGPSTEPTVTETGGTSPGESLPTGLTALTGGPAATGPTGDTGSRSVSPTGITGSTGDSADTGPVLPATCDAGTESWVRRTLPLVWGRKPHGAAEVLYWAQAADRYGRDTAVRAMTRDPQYLAWFKEWFTDALRVARTGDKVDDECFERPLLPSHDGSLAAFVKGNAPETAPYGVRFNMADVIVDALVADDVSVIYQAHLFARMDEPVQGANVSDEELEVNRRIDFGEGFYRTYLSRSLDCVPCHNSEWSTTDHSDPALDHTWQMPGYLELAVMGSSTGLGDDEAYSVFRTEDLTVRNGGVRPWGMDPDCGRFTPPDRIPPSDFLDQPDGFFIDDLDGTASVYDLERMLVAGTTSLEGVGLAVAKDGTVDGEQAFAFLLGATIADQVWQLASGERLVVAHDFPRNEEQMLRLRSLTEPFVVGHYSLVELLVAVATDERLNAGVPASCEAEPYGMAPIFDPWVVDDDDLAKRGNGPGDVVHRLNARSLLWSVHDTLGWRRFDAWHGSFGGGSDEDFQAAVGVFLRESSPGHDGSDLQGLLAFEARYGRCPSDPPPGADDVVRRLLSAAATHKGATVGDVASALTDRLISESIRPEAEPLVEAVLGASLADPVPVGDPDFERAVRRLCGTLLLTPQAQLVVDPTPVGPVPLLALDQAEDCTLVAERMTEVGAPMTCTGTTLQ